MSAKKLRIGFIGCGEIAVAQARQMEKCEKAVLSMAMDVNEALAKDMGEKYSVPSTSKVEELLDNDKVDAVYIAVPHFLHAPLAIQAAEAGKHVMVEKPISTNLEDADRMIAVSREQGVKLCVCYVNRYQPWWQKARELLPTGILGDIIGTSIFSIGDKPAHYWQGGYSGRAQSDWRVYKEKSGGGMLIMNASHNIDQMLWLTGLKVKTVYSIGDTFLTPVEVEDYIVVVNRYDNGAIGYIHASSCARGRSFPGDVRADRIYGSEGQFVMSNPLRVYTNKENDLLEAGKWHEVASDASGDGRKLLTDEFAQAVFEDAAPPVTGEEGRQALELVVAAYRSADSGKPVELPLAN